MAYNEGDLTPTAPTSITWAIAWVRYYLRDTTATEVYSDAEIEAVLTANAWTHTLDGVTSTYYRPHRAAGDMVETDPDRAVTESTLGASVTTRTPVAIASSIRRSGRWIDDAIETAAKEPPPTPGLTLRPTF